MPYDLTTMQSIYHGQDEIVEITYNNSPVYQKSSGPDYTEPFYVENISNSNETLRIKKSSANAPALTIEYLDNTTWSTLCTTSTKPFIKTLQPGAKLYLRCNTNAWASGGSNYNSITGISKIGGNIMSLIYGNEFTGEEKNFKANTQRVLQGLCYGNNKLESAKFLLLPAETLAERCYQNMFHDCTSLTTAPALPATTLAQACYGSMFDSCTSLTTAPALTATTLAESCYESMFDSCTSLTTAPALTATTLAEICYYTMFWGCSSLNYVECLATDISATSATNSWLANVSSTGTFVKAAGVSWSSGANGIPEGWTVIEQ